MLSFGAGFILPVHFNLVEELHAPTDYVVKEFVSAQINLGMRFKLNDAG
jgi:hypothetical protein